MNEDQSSICSCLTASAGLAPCVGRACMRALVDQLGCSSITSKPRPATLRWYAAVLRVIIQLWRSIKKVDERL